MNSACTPHCVDIVKWWVLLWFLQFHIWFWALKQFVCWYYLVPAIMGYVAAMSSFHSSRLNDPDLTSLLTGHNQPTTWKHDSRIFILCIIREWCWYEDAWSSWQTRWRILSAHKLQKREDSAPGSSWYQSPRIWVLGTGITSHNASRP